MSTCPLVVLPSRVVLEKVGVSISDYCTLYAGAQVTVYSPLKEILTVVPSQEQYEREKVGCRPSLINTRFIPELFHAKWARDIVDQLEHDYPHREKRFFVSAFNDRYTQEIQKAANIFDQKKFFWVWYGDATQVVLVRVVLHTYPWQQHIIIGIPSPGSLSL